MKTIINTEKAPAPVGPYNQSVRFGDMLFISGQVAIDPATGALPNGLTVEEETEQVMQNLKAILDEAGLSFEDAIKASVFVADMNNYSRINEVYSKYFNEDTAPARELVEVANLPKFVQVEISLIAGFTN
ncbi:MAG: Rid family detoxifying hydrolase [Saprospiraceae bacterium]|nr:Rid family detoxifying hydrolase [Saprospiraceae bacterium]